MGREIFDSCGLHGKDAEVDAVKTKAGELWDLFHAGTNAPNTQGGRMYAIAKTKLEESVMWFVKGVSRSV